MGNETLYRLGLVRCIVVHHQVKIEFVGNVLLDHPKEPQYFLRVVTRQALPDDRTGATPRAANSVVVPWRVQLRVRRSTCPARMGTTPWVRSSA